MKIIADDNIPFLKGRLEKAGVEVEYVDQFGFTPENVRDADALMIRTRTQCNKSLLDGSSVQLIATATIGMDQIDTDWCKEAGITVRNAPGCNAPGVAQYVWSSLLRMGFDPAHDTLGIVGCGNVGSVVREWGKILGVKMLICDPPKETAQKAAGSHDAEPEEYVSLDYLLRHSDAVTLHTPLTRDGLHPTYHLIGREELSKIGDGKILINAARGPVVDFSALKPEVMSGRLKVTIDTWEGEPKVDPELLDKVAYGTFHIAGYSRQGKERATRMAIEAVEDTFGISVDKTGLEPVYRGAGEMTAKRILQSYDPMDDTVALRKAPAEFDSLRRNYHYREEA